MISQLIENAEERDEVIAAANAAAEAEEAAAAAAIAQKEAEEEEAVASGRKQVRIGRKIRIASNFNPFGYYDED